MRLFANLALALSVAISFVSPSLGNSHQGRRHHVHRQGDLARREPGEINLYKRFDNARFTYYADGLGACGQTNQPGDLIVALNSAQFNGGQYCFQMISITINGKTQQAQIMDECPGCPYAGLDFSQGLFECFADIGAGVLYGTWSFGSGGSSPSSSPSPSPPPPPPPVSVAIPLTSLLPSPTTTLQPPTTTSAPPTPSSSSTAVSSSNSTLVPTQTTTNAVAATAGAVPGGTANSSVLSDVNQYIVDIGQFLRACSGLQ